MHMAKVSLRRCRSQSTVETKRTKPPVPSCVFIVPGPAAARTGSASEFGLQLLLDLPTRYRNDIQHWAHFDKITRNTGPGARSATATVIAGSMNKNSFGSLVCSGDGARGAGATGSRAPIAGRVTRAAVRVCGLRCALDDGPRHTCALPCFTSLALHTKFWTFEWNRRRRPH